MASDQDIRKKIKLLEAVANGKGTTQGERDAAKGRIAALKEKLPKPAAKPKSQISNEELLRMAAAFQNMGGTARTTTRVHQPWVRVPQSPTQTQTNWLKANQQSNAAEARRRAEAQRVWEQRNKQRDDMGRPRPKVDFDEALMNDGRTHEQRQADMQNRNRRPSVKDVGPWCASLGQAESFYDQGGEPRQRNKYAAACDRCHNLVQPGNGCITKVGNLWITRCCEVVPGPRKKKSRHTNH